MKRIALLLLFIVPISAAAFQEVQVPEPTQDPNASFRLFRTENIFMFLKLDTRTGQIWQVQWNVSEDKRFTSALSNVVLVPAGTPDHPAVLRPGRFTLAPTESIHTLMLLDTYDGRVWQVQWGDEKSRFLIAIP